MKFKLTFNLLILSLFLILAPIVNTLNSSVGGISNEVSKSGFSSLETTTPFYGLSFSYNFTGKLDPEVYEEVLPIHTVELESFLISSFLVFPEVYHQSEHHLETWKPPKIS